jgi:hypothetical protein
MPARNGEKSLNFVRAVQIFGPAPGGFIDQLTPSAPALSVPMSVPEAHLGL